jgi:hypothetical protein
MVVLNSVLLFFSKLLFFEFLLGISETLLSSMSAQVNIVSLLDALQLLMFASTLTYFEPKLVLSYFIVVPSSQ